MEGTGQHVSAIGEAQVAVLPGAVLSSEPAFPQYVALRIPYRETIRRAAALRVVKQEADRRLTVR